MILAIWMLVVFVVGAAIGSFLNVCIYRLPLEKSIVWPGSRCGSCLKPIRWQDNVPLLSYWLLGGRCRMCRAQFSSQYFWIELFTGLAFVGLFYLVVVDNVHGFGLLAREGFNIRQGDIPWQAWVIFGHHAVLVCFLIVATGCDLRHREIPLSVTLPGTAVGLVAAVLLPWPWPYTPAEAFRWVALPQQPWWLWMPGRAQEMGLYAWPVWGPLPAWLPPGSWQLGLATGLGGMLFGTFMVRGIRFLFSTGIGKEALGMGDADLMMMAGAFLGWQPIFIAFFLSVFPALLVGVWQMIRSHDNSLPFGPSLAVGIVFTWLCWGTIGPVVQVLLFNWQLMGALVVVCGPLMIVSGYLIRLLRWLRRGSEA